MRTRILHTLIFTPRDEQGTWGLPILFKGKPGVGKSALLSDYFASCGLYCEMLSPAGRGEGAFGVVPVPGEKYLHYPAPDWVEEVEKNGGVVFVDEMSSCPPALQPYLLGLIHDRRVGSYRLSGRVRVIGAANPTEQAAGGWDLAPSVANRQGHMDWQDPTAEEWGDYMMGLVGSKPVSKMDAKVEEKRVLANWNSPWAKALAVCAAFVRRRPDLLHKMPKANDPQMSVAWPSPRTWELAARAMAGAEVHNLNESDTDDLVTAFVGQGAASELLAWRAEADLPEPADLLDGKVKYKHNPKRLDRTSAVLMSCAAYVAYNQPDANEKFKETRIKRAGVLWGLMDECSDSKNGGAIDIVVPAARRLVDAGLAVMNESDAVMFRMEPVLSAAGIKSRR